MGSEHGKEVRKGDSGLNAIQREILRMKFSVREHETRREDKGVCWLQGKEEKRQPSNFGEK